MRGSGEKRHFSLPPTQCRRICRDRRSRRYNRIRIRFPRFLVKNFSVSAPLGDRLSAVRTDERHGTLKVRSAVGLSLHVFEKEQAVCPIVAVTARIAGAVYAGRAAERFHADAAVVGESHTAERARRRFRF